MRYCSTTCPGRIEDHICGPQSSYPSGSVTVPSYAKLQPEVKPWMNSFESQVLLILNQILEELRKK